jgi:hypothetical protein
LTPALRRFPETSIGNTWEAAAVFFGAAFPHSFAFSACSENLRKWSVAHRAGAGRGGEHEPALALKVILPGRGPPRAPRGGDLFLWGRALDYCARKIFGNSVVYNTLCLCNNDRISTAASSNHQRRCLSWSVSSRLIDGLKAFFRTFFADAGGICATALDVVGAGAAAFGGDKIGSLYWSRRLSALAYQPQARREGCEVPPGAHSRAS